MSWQSSLGSSVARLAAIDADAAFQLFLQHTLASLSVVITIMAVGRVLILIAAARLNERPVRRKLSARSYSLDLLLPIRVARDAQASLEEVMPIWIAEWGPKRARRIWRLQIFLIVAGHYTSPILTLLERVLKIVSGRSSAE
jgi:hypothetical protein